MANKLKDWKNKYGTTRGGTARKLSPIISGSDGRGVGMPQIKGSSGLRSGFNNPLKRGGGTSGSRGGSSSGGRESRGYDRGLRGMRQSANQMSSMGSNIAGHGSSLMDQFNSIFTPAMQKAVQFADVNEQQMVDEASLDVGSQYDKASDIQGRRLSRMGISPTSGRYQGQEMDLNLARAATLAGARNKSRIQARDLSFNRNMALAGRVMPLASGATSAMSAGASQMNAAGRMHSEYAQEYGRELEGKGFAEGLGGNGTPKR